MIEFRHVSKRYAETRLPAVDDLSLTVPDGEICVLVGPSGSGKTTTMRMVNRLIEPTSGSILIDGVPNTSLDRVELRRRIGYAIQQVGLFPHRTVAENIATVPSLLRWSKQRVGDRVEELLALVGLDPAVYRGRYPSELSGGQQQRVGVARALAADPPILLMDEPFGAVDPVARERLQSEFLAIQHRLRKTVIFVTHDIDEAVRIGDRIAILAEGGRLAQYDSPADILTRPANEFVASFLSADRALKRLSLLPMSQLPLPPATPDDRERLPTIEAGANLRESLGLLVAAGSESAVVVGCDGTPRVLTARDIWRAFSARADGAAESGRGADEPAAG